MKMVYMDMHRSTMQNIDQSVPEAATGFIGMYNHGVVWMCYGSITLTVENPHYTT